jgi:hypothetical protein
VLPTELPRTTGVATRWRCLREYFSRLSDGVQIEKSHGDNVIVSDPSLRLTQSQLNLPDRNVSFGHVDNLTMTCVLCATLHSAIHPNQTIPRADLRDEIKIFCDLFKRPAAMDGLRKFVEKPGALTYLP